ncbi:hypothetical protein IE987_25540 [Klebsiella pneumoniae]|uniref:Uncharacterized protein n=1 Tax=Klebsiella pneumoniae TaxID=573 RepID=A0A927DJS5_KLEPN|nr:hypothetical protein [Klebsiella pneumoniae]
MRSEIPFIATRVQKSDHPYTVTHNPTIAIVVLANDDCCHSPAPLMVAGSLA